jgi:hypothetical protein
MIEQSLDELLIEYKQNRDALVKECQSVDEEIAKLQSRRKSLAEPWQKLMNDAELKMWPLMNVRKESFVNKIGRITYTKASKRRSWNLDGLDLVCKNNPTVNDIIWTLRDEEPIDARIAIKVN